MAEKDGQPSASSGLKLKDRLALLISALRRIEVKDRLALSIAALSLCVSLASPVVSYLWLQNEQRINSIKSRSLLGMPLLVSRGKSAPVLWLEVWNRGDLPIKDVTISVRKKGSAEDGPLFPTLDQDYIDCDPPLPHKVSLNKGVMVIAFEDPFPGGTDVKVRLMEFEGFDDTEPDKGWPLVWLGSENTPPTPLGYGYSWVREDPESPLPAAQTKH